MRYLNVNDKDHHYHIFYYFSLQLKIFLPRKQEPQLSLILPLCQVCVDVLIDISIASLNISIALPLSLNISIALPLSLNISIALPLL